MTRKPTSPRLTGVELAVAGNLASPFGHTTGFNRAVEINDGAGGVSHHSIDFDQVQKITTDDASRVAGVQLPKPSQLEVQAYIIRRNL